MRVLWITNIVFPEALGLLHGDASFKQTGGWMLAAANALWDKGIDLYVASVCELCDTVAALEGERIKYYLLPYGRGNFRENPEYEKYWKQVRDSVKPDIVHIHGTEFSHGWAYVNACGPTNVAVSIQGILTEYAKHYFDGMTWADVVCNTTVRDIVKKDTLFQNRRDFVIRSAFERKLLKSVNHIIGRTEWDKSFALQVNESAFYHHCNETLRPELYYDKWSHHGNNVVFVSQGTYPVKGLHQLLKAVARMKTRPVIRVAGYNIADRSSIKRKLAIRSYGKYLSRLIRKYGLQESVIFTGPLSAAEMKKEYLACDASVCPSSLENSSNAIAEAQLLGVPVIASRRGGTPSMITDGQTGFLYDYYDLDHLEQLIKNVLDSDCSDISSQERQMALERHNPEANANMLLNIYESIHCNL